MDYWQIGAYLAFTFIISWLVGFERQNIGKDAGISAHVLVAMAACGIAILQRELFMETDSVRENQRMISQLLTGMGFIGAGVIMKSGSHIRGLTTAATLWICSIIGIIIGTGYWQFGLIMGGFTVIFIYVRDFCRKVNPFKKHHEFDEEKQVNDK